MFAAALPCAARALSKLSVAISNFAWHRFVCWLLISCTGCLLTVVFWRVIPLKQIGAVSIILDIDKFRFDVLVASSNAHILTTCRQAAV